MPRPGIEDLPSRAKCLNDSSHYQELRSSPHWGGAQMIYPLDVSIG